MFRREGLFRTWHPLLVDDDKKRALSTVDSIAEALGTLPLATTTGGEPIRYGGRIHPSLAEGEAGYALFFAYLDRHRPGEGFADRAIAHLETAIELLSDAETLPGLYSGFTGVAWVTDHLRELLGLDPDDDPNEGIDEALLEHMNQSPWLRHFDLIGGLAGFGVYALSRLPRPTAAKCLEALVDRLTELAVERSEGVAWHTPPELLVPETRKDYPEGYDNLGVAHGVPGLVAVLAQVCAAGISRARPLLDAAVRWMLAQKLEPGAESVFPYSLASNSVPRTTRAAWCYGDPGIAAALLASARAVSEPAWEREALELARTAARREPATTEIKDACLCHGAAGLAHLLNSFYQATGEDLFRDRARFWFRQALELRRPGEGFAGYAAWDLNARGEMEWLPVPGFLTGAAGVGLALLAAATPHEPRWDEVLLVSPISNGALRHTGAGARTSA